MLSLDPGQTVLPAVGDVTYKNTINPLLFFLLRATCILRATSAFSGEIRSHFMIRLKGGMTVKSSPQKIILLRSEIDLRDRAGLVWLSFRTNQGNQIKFIPILILIPNSET